MNDQRLPGAARMLDTMAEAAVDLLEAAAKEAREAARRRQKERIRASNAATQRYWVLHPGAETPLWNQLLREVRPWLRPRGAQAQLARVLGLTRQRLNRCLTAKAAMLDAERALLLLGWLEAQRRRRTLPTPPPGEL